MTINKQISMDDLIQEEEEKTREKVTLPPVTDNTEKVYVIPDDIWKGRCRLCVHKHAEENASVPLWAVHKQQYAELIPCRIMTIAGFNDVQGECMSFTPRLDTYGICRTCVHTSIFHDGYCRKANHAQVHQVYIGQDWGQEYYRQSLNVCDD